MRVSGLPSFLHPHLFKTVSLCLDGEKSTHAVPFRSRPRRCSKIDTAMPSVSQHTGPTTKGPCSSQFEEASTLRNQQHLILAQRTQRIGPYMNSLLQLFCQVLLASYETMLLCLDSSLLYRSRPLSPKDLESLLYSKSTSFHHSPASVTDCHHVFPQ